MKIAVYYFVGEISNKKYICKLMNAAAKEAKEQLTTPYPTDRQQLITTLDQLMPLLRDYKKTEQFAEIDKFYKQLKKEDLK